MSTGNVRRRANAGKTEDEESSSASTPQFPPVLTNTAAMSLSRGGITRQTDAQLALLVRLFILLVVVGALYGVTKVSKRAVAAPLAPLPTLAELEAIIQVWEEKNPTKKDSTASGEPTPQGPIPHRLWLPDCDRTKVSTGFTSENPQQQCRDNVRNTISKYHAVWATSQIAPKRRRMAAYPEVKYLTDDECLLLIELAKVELLQPFRVEYNNDFKYDICRIAALYLYGGYYFDVEVEVMTPVAVEDDSISFVTAVEASHHGFFEAFVGSTPKHPILRETLNKMAEYYEQAYVKPTDLSSEKKMSIDDAIGKGPDDDDAGADDYNGKDANQEEEEDLGYIDIMVQQNLVEEDPSWKLGPRTLKDAYISLSEEARGKTLLLQEINLDPPELYGHWYPKVSRRRNLSNQQCCCNYIVHDPRTETPHFFSRVVETTFC